MILRLLSNSLPPNLSISSIPASITTIPPSGDITLIYDWLTPMSSFSRVWVRQHGKTCSIIVGVVKPLVIVS